MRSDHIRKFIRFTRVAKLHSCFRRETGGHSVSMVFDDFVVPVLKSKFAFISWWPSQSEWSHEQTSLGSC